MANRIAATYGGNTDGGPHTISFSAPTPGARLIVVVTSWNSLESDPAGWTRDYGITGYSFVTFFSKISDGTERSIVFPHADSRLHAVVYERNDCPQRLFSSGGTSTGASVSSSVIAVPAGAAGHVFAVVNNPSGSASSSTWNLGLTRHFTRDSTSSNSAFAHGALPAAGNRTFTVSNLVTGSNSSVLGVVGYGSTDLVAPTAPASLRTTSISGEQISVEWDAATDNLAVVGYGVYQDGVKQGGDVPVLHHTYAGLTAGQTYTLEVDAADAAGNRSPKAGITVLAEVDVTPPTTPGTLSLVEATFNSLAFAWDAATDNVGVAGYGVYLGGVKQGGDQAERTHTITRLARGTSYTLQVDAADAAGNRSAPALLVASTLAGADPSAPPGLTATAGVEQITLAWGASDPGGVPVA
ncbi:hypothetical protein ACFWYW_47160, partial [Nonomuraea sp. NPDC059023]